MVSLSSLWRMAARAGGAAAMRSLGMRRARADERDQGPRRAARHNAPPDPSPLLTDLYQLAMTQAYLAAGRVGTASFEFFVRRLPPGRRFLVAAGLAQAVEWLRDLRFAPAELGWLRASGLFSPALIDHLATLRLDGGRGIHVAEDDMQRVHRVCPPAQPGQTISGARRDVAAGWRRG